MLYLNLVLIGAKLDGDEMNQNEELFFKFKETLDKLLEETAQRTQLEYEANFQAINLLKNLGKN